ncbi:MAG: plastocyanin/azurin family copper-binding protein [Bacteroidota bacterium]
MKNKLFLTIIAMLVLALANLGVAGNIIGKVSAKGAKNGGDAVIYLDKIAGKSFTAPKEHVLMDQKNLAFKPHVLPVLAGTTVDFQNSDNVLHNVFSPDQCTGKFNLGSWPQGQKKSFTFTKAGCNATLLCNVHPEMEGFVVVLETPYYAVSDKDGSYKIKDVPAGKYTLKIWHEKLKGKDVEITVPATGDVTTNIDIHK